MNVHTADAPRTTGSDSLRGFFASPTYLRLDIRRVMRNRRAMIFTVAMPALLYLVFGATQKTSDAVGSGNVAFYVLIGMAVYGAAALAFGAVRVADLRGQLRRRR